MSTAIPARRLPRVTPGIAGGLTGLICGLLALGPALRPGYLLFYDMVFVPRLPLSARTLGIDGSVPRAVPNDLVVALASSLLPGWLVQKILLLAVFVLVGSGVGGMLRTRTGAVAAAVCAAWNPYVGERLAIGHWGFLLGYAVLPHLARATAAWAGDRRGGRARTARWTVLMALTGSTGAVFGLLVTACVLLAGAARWGRRLGRTAVALGFFLLANAVWWFPFLFLAPRESGDPAGVSAFMARADTPWGVVLSVLTGGGIWNRGVWFAERSGVVTSGLALLGVVAAVGALARSGRLREPLVRGVLVAGVIGAVLAFGSALPGGRGLVTWIVREIPGGGLLRDSQKFAAPWMLAVALGAGMLAEVVRRAGRRLQAAPAAVALAVAVAALWPVATLPGLAWGAGGKWRAVDYPPAYRQIAEVIAAQPQGSVAVFPWTLYRRYAWDHRVVVLDPWQRLVDRDVLVNDDLPLSDRVVRGESTRARAVGDALRSGDPVPVLRREGVTLVLVQTDQPAQPGIVTGLPVLARAPGLVLMRVPGAVGDATPAPTPTAWTGLGGLALAVLGAAGLTVAERVRTGSRR
ncbi:hypothetical protein G9U51_04030 [Calidifontibacter sp. DB0510]|uniref:Uncharacterized protein n=1 Tax=Metallococcus carri TaxID=1656884 RepID=A0A967AYW5_9MICO|nr:hypothetical protein [Metallococcus carri]NHN54954.1 hypothetical protein [Metallococcus carri]NOP37300.1 hypothetical protein [Calidifontibacter sp. DB2511S]